MKKTIQALFLLTVFGIGFVFALSFSSETIFLNADTKESCEEVGGSFIERYEEIYCTVMPDELLSDEDQSKIGLVADKINELIKDERVSYESVVTLLETFRKRFYDEVSPRKLAIIIVLQRQIEDIPEFIEIPSGCHEWYDGCNTCTMGEDGQMACTKRACIQHDEPKCLSYQRTIKVADHKEECVGVGPQTCYLIMKEGEEEWTYFYGMIRGFKYIPGYEWTLLVEERHLDPSEVPTDASTIQWSLIEVLEVTGEVPELCTTWYDGCNICTVAEDGQMACTLKACVGEPLVPYCLDDGLMNMQAVEYNESLTE